MQEKGSGPQEACALFQEPGQSRLSLLPAGEAGQEQFSLAIPSTPDPVPQVKTHNEEDFKALQENTGMSPFLLISQTVKHVPRGLGERK